MFGGGCWGRQGGGLSRVGEGLCLLLLSVCYKPKVSKFMYPNKVSYWSPAIMKIWQYIFTGDTQLYSSQKSRLI